MKFVCPNCHQIPFKLDMGDFDYDVFQCKGTCLQLYYHNEVLHYYLIAQSKGNYILTSSTLQQKTILRKPTVPKATIILEFPHFFPLASQEEMNGIIDRLLRLKAFS